ncbi:N-acetyltransferase esco2 [Mortierella sp. GBA35]|nr:N-acetyltransferase esco2 [Mortierella sp. GBA35]
MNTPASSSAASTGSDTTSSPGPNTPKREYKFHTAVRKTYGRAKPSELRSSSPDAWSSQLSFSPSNSTNSTPVQQQRRSRLSGSFGELVSSSSEAWMTPTRGTRSLIDELNRAKLDLDIGDSDEDDDTKEDTEDLENVFKVRGGSTAKKDTTTLGRKRSKEDEDVSSGEEEDTGLVNNAGPQTTPSRQRKRQLIDIVNASPVRRSPRSAPQGRHKQDRLGNSIRTPSPRSSSPSPPASPTRRSTLTAVVLPSLPSPAKSVSKASSSSTTSFLDPKGGDTRKSGQQATISSFFTTKAGTGTGILKGKTGSANHQKSATLINDRDSIPATATAAAAALGDRDQTPKRTTSGTLSSQEPPKKLEQLFLAFSKDRTKTSTAATATKQPLATARRPTQLRREDDRLRRYHCPQCGMPYVRGQPEDEQIHDRYHRAALGGIDYPGYKNEIVVARYRDQESESKGDSLSSSSSSSGASPLWGDTSSSRIVMVSMTDPGRTTSASASGSNFEKKKVKEVLEVVNKELGSVDFDPEHLDSCKVFLYISGKKKVVGCVIAERIKEGFEVMTLAGTGAVETVVLESRAGSATSSSSASSGDTKSLVSTSLLSTDKDSDDDRNTNERKTQLLQISNGTDRDGGGAAIFCSKVPQPAICGINRIWVSSQHRRQRIASRMLDAVRDRFIYACKLETKDLAFSQPTGDGKALARQYLGTDRFLVYVE